MITKTRDEILDYIHTHGQARPDELVRFLGISRVAVHKQLARLLRDNKLIKRGRSPRVFYTFSQKMPLLPVSGITQVQQKLIQDNFLFITPDGALLYGLEGFSYWRQNFQREKTVEELASLYEKTLKEKNTKTSQEGLIDATEKMKHTFSDCQVDKLLFVDIYSYPLFGRTKLAKLVMYAKQAGNISLIPEIVSVAAPLIEKAINTFSLQAVAFIPPTVPRKLQFMSELALALKVQLPKIDIAKVVAGDIAIPQKTLPRLEDRVVNARNTMFITPQPAYPRILLIDDVVGSGASFQESARKLRAIGIGRECIVAIALVGNIKGFDVIREI